MKRLRVPWTIAAAAVSVAILAFFFRNTMSGRTEGSVAAARQIRDRQVAEMLRTLDLDPRLRRASTRNLVEAVARYCSDPVVATAETWYALGLRKYYGDFDMAGAQEAFERASRMRPKWAWPVNGLAIVEFVSGRRDEAMRSFAHALELDPKWSRPHSDMAILLRRAGEMNEAMDEAERALEIEPDHPVNNFNYGVILDELGRHAEARARYERVLAAEPDMPQAAYNLACSYGREGDTTQALRYLEQAIAGEPAFREEAPEDPDFSSIRDDPAFRRVVARDSGSPSP